MRRPLLPWRNNVSLFQLIRCIYCVTTLSLSPYFPHQLLMHLSNYTLDSYFKGIKVEVWMFFELVNSKIIMVNMLGS